MEKEINEKFIKVSSRLPIGIDIALGDDLILKLSNSEVTLNFVLNCVKEETFDKQDGSVDKVYVLKYAGE